MASQSNNGQQTLSQNQIGNIVDSQLKQNNLTTIINNNQRQLIINLLVNVQKAGSLKNNDFKAQAGKLADSIQNSAKGLFDKLKKSGMASWVSLMVSLNGFRAWSNNF